MFYLCNTFIPNKRIKITFLKGTNTSVFEHNEHKHQSVFEHQHLCSNTTNTNTHRQLAPAEDAGPRSPFRYVVATYIGETVLDNKNIISTGKTSVRHSSLPNSTQG